MTDLTEAFILEITDFNNNSKTKSNRISHTGDKLYNKPIPETDLTEAFILE